MLQIRSKNVRQLGAVAALAIAALLQDGFHGGASAQTTAAVTPAPAPAPSSDWTTWGYDGERTGWNRGETTLSKTSVSRLALKWQATVDTKPDDVVLTTLTAPVVLEGAQTASGLMNLLFVQGADGSVFALDAESGRLVWKKAYPHQIAAQRSPNVNCANTVQATPVIDKRRGLIFFTDGDGVLHGLTAGGGEERMRPIQMVAPYSRSWSLNLIEGVVYVASGRGCGNGQPLEWGAVSAVDVSDLAFPQFSRFYTSKGRAAGPWGRGGPVKGPKGVYVQTADGQTDLGSGVFAHAVVAVYPKAYGVADSFVAPNWKYLNTHDLDLGSGSPVVFPFGKRTLVATGAKESVVYLLDANNLGGGAADHSEPLYQSPRMGNDEQTYAAKGIWGGVSTYLSPLGDRFIYLPMWGDAASGAPAFKVSYGDTPNGSIMAFKVRGQGDQVSLEPEWISHDLTAPDSVTIANGVVFAVQTGEQTIQHPDNPEGHGAAIAGRKPLTVQELGKYRSTPIATMTLFALDAETGKELWSSKKAMDSYTHFSQPVVALGKVFVVSHDAKIYSFGLK